MAQAQEFRERWGAVSPRFGPPLGANDCCTALIQSESVNMRCIKYYLLLKYLDEVPGLEKGPVRFDGPNCRDRHTSTQAIQVLGLPYRCPCVVTSKRLLIG